MSSRNRRCGFMYIAVLFLLMLVATAISLMAAQTYRQSARIAQMRTRAQLEQLLLAGTFDASEHLESAERSPFAANDAWDMTLPSELAESSASVRVTALSVEATAVEFEIRAEFEKYALSQIVRFARVETGWFLKSANLNG